MTKKVTETKYGGYMENEKTKVELEDIVGLVQTDDSTNSVQLKKEAQLSICEKRVLELEKENEQLKQFKEDVFQLIDKLLKEWHHYEMDCRKGKCWGTADRFICYQMALLQFKEELQS